MYMRRLVPNTFSNWLDTSLEMDSTSLKALWTGYFVSIDRDSTEEFNVEQYYAVDTTLTALKYIEDTHTDFKKISAQVDTRRAETEEIAVEQ
jgi:hypothetical protein